MPGLSDYDRERKRSQNRWAAIKSGSACVVVGCVLLFIFLIARVWVPYTRLKENRYAAQRKAAVYLKSDVCTNDATRSQLEGYNHCEASDRIVRQPAWLGAFYDLMEELSICNADRCVFMGFNITAILPRLAVLMTVVVALVFAVSTCGFFNASFRYHTGLHTLPMTTYGADSYLPVMVGGAGLREGGVWLKGADKSAKFD